MKKAAFFILCCCCALPLLAEDADAAAGSNEIVLQISTLPELKLGFTHRFSIPFLQGDSPFTAGNNLGFAFSAEISPISLNGRAEVVWTPIAFFQLTAGGRIGSGWNISLFGGDIYGIGLNTPSAPGKATGSAFDGLLYKAQVGAVLQMDIAALFPGDWNHLVVRTQHEVDIKGYTGAKAHEAWFYESDSGENINGFNYYGNVLIGYQMPIFLNMVALLTEMDLYLYDTPGRGYWGDDLIRWTFSGVLNFTVTKQFGAALITQFVTRRNFMQTGWKDLYYRDRQLDTSNPLHLEFYRIAAILTYSL